MNIEYSVTPEYFFLRPLPCLGLALRSLMTPASSDRRILVPASACDDDPRALVMPPLLLVSPDVSSFLLFPVSAAPHPYFWFFTLFVYCNENSHISESTK